MFEPPGHTWAHLGRQLPECCRCSQAACHLYINIIIILSCNLNTGLKDGTVWHLCSSVNLHLSVVEMWGVCVRGRGLCNQLHGHKNL